MKRILLITCLLAFAVNAFANNPGKHSVVLTWQDAGCSGLSCTYNLYRSSSGNACTGINNPTPYATGIVSLGFTDTNVTLGTTYNYNVSAVDSVTGGESACDTEVQIAVPNITTPVPAALTGTVQ